MTPEELKILAKKERSVDDQPEHTVRVCMAASCLSTQADKVAEGIEASIKADGKEEKCKVKCVGCMGLCSAGPLVSVEDKQGNETMYRDVTPEDAELIAKSVGGKPVDRLRCPMDVPFFTRQKRVVLENSGRIDPERIEDYIAEGGYSALAMALTEMSTHEVREHIKASGLRGRGGAGYPTGLKWSNVAKMTSEQKYVICNADEGDPGAFMDRAVLESDPHRVLEGMALGAYAVGANRGYVYVRAEYPLAIKRLKIAIKQATRMGLLGRGICGTPFSFDIEIRLGAGAFVCGEETALIASIEGKRGQPRPRPPYPANYGLFGKPTLINNVETLASIPAIIREGGDWYAGIGTEKSKGTKVFALAGSVKNTGLIEVPMGIPLRDIIFDIGGGVSEGRKLKAVQTGGPSGGCIPEQFMDMSVDYESLAEVGSIMGSGGMIVMDETSDMVDVARFFMEFCMSESCGKCVPCRVGTWQMHGLLDKIYKGEGTPADLDLLKELCDVVKHTSLCGLGQTAPNPVLSTLKYFEDDYTGRLVSPAGNGKGHAVAVTQEVKP